MPPVRRLPLRRLRRYQWQNGLSLEKAREILAENTVDYPAFHRIMTETYASPAVKESYRRDRDRLLQLTDRLYAEELLEIPGPGWKRVGRKTLLHLLYLFSLERRAAAAPGTRPSGAEERRSEHV